MNSLNSFQTLSKMLQVFFLMSSVTKPFTNPTIQIKMSLGMTLIPAKCLSARDCREPSSPCRSSRHSGQVVCQGAGHAVLQTPSGHLPSRLGVGGGEQPTTKLTSSR